MKSVTYTSSALALFAASASATAACGDTVTSNNLKFKVDCDTDRYGGDLPNGLVWVSSLDGCIAACSSNELCRGAVYNPGTPGPCYLKSELKPSSTSTGQITVSNYGTKCPVDDGITVTSNSRDFHVECATDRPGGDLPNGLVYVSSIDECIAACAVNSACRGATWNPGSPGPCYLKSELKEGNWSPTGQVSFTNLLYTCPRNDGTTAMLTADSSYVVECSVDRIGGDMANSPVYVPDLEHCMAACESTDGCVVATFKPSGTRSNGPCYLKSSVQPGFTDTTTWGLRRSSVCPDEDGQTYTATCGATYQVECGKDRYGSVMAPGPVTTASFKQCVDLCGSTAGCVDVSWSHGFPSGTCYLKNGLGAQEDDVKIWGAKLLTGCGQA